MSKVRIMGTSLMAVLTLSLIAAPGALANGRPLHAALAGPEDPDGAGTARLRLNQGRHRICYKLEATAIDAPTAAHIHAVATDEAVIVVTLWESGVGEFAQGCVTGLERALIKAIRQHPAHFYVNVHTTDFPAGALRGQLGKWRPGHHH